MKNLLEEKDIALKILKDLNKLVTIPNRGFLAGGAVANTLLRMKNKDSEYKDNLYPINDLDIFIESESENNQSNTPLRTKELIIQEGYFAGEIGYDEDSNYRILNVSREGLINTITISQIADLQNNRDYSYILNAFDFNCCQIGIDLETGNIFYTSHFVEFFKSNQLDITSLYTPGHTAIRLFKKIKELNCYCNIEKCMEILSQPLIPSIRWRLTPIHWGFYFSHKYKDIFMKYFSEIKTYFKMVKFFDDKKELWYKRHEELNGTKKSTDKKHISNWLNPDVSIPTETLSKWAEYNDIMWALRPIRYVEPNSEIIDKADLGYSCPIAFVNAYHYINGKIKKSLHKKCDLIMNNSIYLRRIVMINLEFANCDFSVGQIKELDEYCKIEIDFIFAIQKYRLNLQESLVLFKDIKKIQNKEGEWIKYIIINSLMNSNRNIKPTYKKILKDVAEYKQLMSKPLTTPLIKTNKLSLPSGVTIKEILSETEMQWAGNKLKNCINNENQGYKHKIESGLVRIFMIMTKGSTSALELHLDSKDSIEIKEKQLLSSCNRKPSRFHRIIADMLIGYINLELLESRYESRKKLYGDILSLHTGLLATTSDDTTDNNEQVFGLDDLDFPIDEREDEMHGEFDFDFGNDTIINRPRRLAPNIDITLRDGETRHIREWVSRTITPVPVDYTINTTLRDSDNPDPDDVWGS